MAGKPDIDLENMTAFTNWSLQLTGCCDSPSYQAFHYFGAAN